MPDLPIGPAKPKIHSPCNGCGLCCVADACEIARAWVPEAKPHAPCPALEFEGGRFWCGMVRHPFKHSPAAAEFGMPEAVFGKEVSETLGGVGGRCDSGPVGTHIEDKWAGLTAQEYLEIHHG